MMKKMSPALFSFLLVLLLAPTTGASNQQVTGSIVSIEDESLVINTKDGEKMTFQITEETEIPSDLKKETQVTVSYHAGDDGELVADQVTPVSTQTAPSGFLLNRH